jgi:hypothetical protein
VEPVAGLDTLEARSAARVSVVVLASALPPVRRAVDGSRLQDALGVLCVLVVTAVAAHTCSGATVVHTTTLLESASCKHEPTCDALSYMCIFAEGAVHNSYLGLLYGGHLPGKRSPEEPSHQREESGKGTYEPWNRLAVDRLAVDVGTTNRQVQPRRLLYESCWKSDELELMISKAFLSFILQPASAKSASAPWISPPSLDGLGTANSRSA